MSTTEKLTHYFQMENATSVLEDVISQMDNAPEDITRVDEDEVQNIVGLVNQNIVEGEFEETAALDDGLLGADQSLEVMKDSLIDKNGEMQAEAANFFTRLFDTFTDQFKDIWGQNEQRLKRLKEAREHIEKFEGDTLTLKNKDVYVFKLGNKVDMTKVVDNMGQMVDMVKKNDLAKMYLDGIRLMAKHAVMGQNKPASKFIETMRRNPVYKVPTVFGEHHIDTELSLTNYTAKISNALQMEMTLPLPFSSRLPDVAVSTFLPPVEPRGEVKVPKKDVIAALDKLIKITSDVPTEADFQRTRRLIISELDSMANEKVELKPLDDSTRKVTDTFKKQAIITGTISLLTMAWAYTRMNALKGGVKVQTIAYGSVFLGQSMSALNALSKKDSYERDLIVNGDIDIFGSTQNPIVQMFLTKVANSLSSRTTALVINQHTTVQHLLNVLTKKLPIAVYRAK